jgi:hypothetical protein
LVRQKISTIVRILWPVRQSRNENEVRITQEAKRRCWETREVCHDNEKRVAIEAQSNHPAGFSPASACFEALALQDRQKQEVSKTSAQTKRAGAKKAKKNSREPGHIIADILKAIKAADLPQLHMPCRLTS